MDAALRYLEDLSVQFMTSAQRASVCYVSSPRPLFTPTFAISAMGLSRPLLERPLGRSTKARTINLSPLEPRL